MVRRVIVAGIVLALTAAACGTQEDGIAETALPPPTTITTTTVPSTTTTGLPPTSTSTTATPETTTTAPAGSLTFNFAIVRGEDNTALDDGEPGEWDSQWAFAPWVVHRDGLYHLFYTGWGDAGLAIGYATSENGLDFEEHEDNPIVDLQPNDGGAVDAGRAVVRVGDDGAWEMFIGEWVDKTTQGNGLWRATAPSPSGPWKIDRKPLYRSERGKWDARLVPQSLVPDTDIVLYDGLRVNDMAFGALIGDGDTWEPFDDPATDGEGSISDPIFTAAADSGEWDQANVASPIVFATEDGFEMFYSGWFRPRTKPKERYLSLGYATSPDGLRWARYEANPVVEMTGETGWLWMSGVRVGDVYNLYYAIQAGKHGIGVVSGTISEP